VQVAEKAQMAAVQNASYLFAQWSVPLAALVHRSPAVLRSYLLLCEILTVAARARQHQQDMPLVQHLHIFS
jgi:hypothetical protein